METRERKEQPWDEVALLRKKLARAERRCRQAEEANGRLAAVLELVNEAACVLDHKGRLLFINAAGRATLGLPGDITNGVGKTFLSRYTPAARETLVTKGLPLATQHGHWEGSVTFRSKGQGLVLHQRLQANRTPHGALFYASVLRPELPTEDSCPKNEDLARLYGELAKDLPVGLGVWRQESQGSAASRDSLSFQLLAVNEVAGQLLGVPMRVGDTVAETAALTTSGKRDFGDFLAETLRSGRVLAIPRFRLHPSAQGELTIRAFPLGPESVGVFFQAATTAAASIPSKLDSKKQHGPLSVQQEQQPSQQQYHPLLEAMTASTSFAFCLARRWGKDSSGSEWTFDYVSRGLSHVLGCRSEELLGRGVLSLCARDADGGQSGVWSLSVAMSEGRECAVSTVLRTSLSSSSVRCRLWASPLEGGAAYLLFYSQFKEEGDRPGSPTHILSFTEDEDVFCRIFDSLTIGMLLWRKEDPPPDDGASSRQRAEKAIDGAPATGGRRPRFRLLAVNKKAHSFNLSGIKSVGCYFEELTPELVETGLLEAYTQILTTGQPGPLGMIPLRHEGFKECNLIATGFPVSSTLLAVLFEEIPAVPSIQVHPSPKLEQPTRPGSRPSSPPCPLSPAFQQQLQQQPQPQHQHGPTLPPILSRKRNRGEGDVPNYYVCSETMDHDASTFRAHHPRPPPPSPQPVPGASSAHHPFVRVPTPFKRQRGSAFAFGELPSPSTLIEPKGIETGVGVWWEWCRSSPAACAVLEVEGNDRAQIIQANEAFGDMVGYPSERLTRAFFSVVSPDSERKAATMAAGDGPAIKHGETTYRSRCGQTVACVESMWLLPQGRVAVLVQPIAALRERFPSALDDRIFQRCFAAAPLGVGLVGKEGRLVEANAALHVLLGHPSSDLVGQTFHTFIHPDDVEAVLSLPYRMVHSGLPSTQLVVRCRRRDGATLFCLLCLSLINDASTGTTTHLLITLQSMDALEGIFRDTA